MRATRVRTLAQSFGSAPLCETLKQWLRGYTARTHLRVHAYSFFFFLLLLSLSLPHLPFHPTATGYFTLNSNLSLPLPVLLPLLASPTAFTVLLYALYPRFTILDDNSFRPTLFSFHTLARIYCLPRSSLSLLSFFQKRWTLRLTSRRRNSQNSKKSSRFRYLKITTTEEEA